MYTIYYDGFPIWNPVEGYYVSSPNYAPARNKAGAVTFEIDPTHPYYDRLAQISPLLVLRKRNLIKWIGRIVRTRKNFNNSISVTAEGYLACLHDSKVRPFVWAGPLYTYVDDEGVEQEGLFNHLIKQHNAQVPKSQRFTIGTISPDLLPNNYIIRTSVEYKDTWEIIEQQLIKQLGGYITLDYTLSAVTINYLTANDLPGSSTQTIEFASNLIDLEQENDGTEIYTACIPLGGKLKDISGDVADVDDHTRLTIENVETYDTASEDILKDGDILYSVSREALYGCRIIAPVDKTTWDDVSEGRELVTKGSTFLMSDAAGMADTIEAQAVDLNVVDSTIDDLSFLDVVTLRSAVHNAAGTYIIEKMNVPLDAPENMKVTFGGAARQLSDITSQQRNNEATTSERLSRLEQGVTLGAVITGMTQEFSSRLAQLSDSIVSQVLASETIVKAQQYYTKCESTTSGAMQIVSGEAEDGQISIIDVSPTADGYIPAVGDYVYVVTGAEDYAALKSLVTSIVTQTADVLDLSFLTAQVRSEVDAATGGISQTITELSDFIRFGSDASGSYMLLGRAGDPFSQKIGRTRNEFIQNGATVAYFNGNKLYVTDGEFLTSLILGKFAFVPRANGNLSLRKVK